MLGHMIRGMPDVAALVALFSISIFIHELGHYLMARWCGLVVEVFSIGFGPAIWKRKIGGITYKIGCLPLGGYVALPQLDPSGMEKIQGAEANAEPESVSYPAVAPWKKILVAVSGPTGNVLLAIVLAWIIYLHPQAATTGNSTDIGYVATNSPAYAAGLRPGDRVLSMADRRVRSWYQMQEEAVLRRRAADGLVAAEVLRNGATVRLELPIGEPRTQPLPGVGPSEPCRFVRIDPAGPLAQAGVKLGDTLCTVDGVEVVGTQHAHMLTAERAGESAEVTLRRDGELLALRVPLPLAGLSEDLPPIVGRALPGSGAAEAGLQRGDVVTAFNGRPIVGRVHLSDLIQEHGETPCTLSIRRGAELLDVVLTPRHDAEAERILVGIQWAYDPGLPWMRFKEPWAQISNDARGILRILKALLTPKEAGNAGAALGGPVMIFAALWAAIKISMLNALGFLRFLNVNLAMINLLPLPVLDGGHIVFALWETVTRRKVHARVVNVLVNVFAVLLIGVFILLTVRDVDQLFPGIRRFFHRGAATEQVARPAPTNDVPTNGVTEAP
jgi:membrane-associated protease RseP (regulator of RpoE activity)